MCGEACNGREAVEKATQLMPDVIVMDVSMPGLNGLEATRQIVKTNPATKVLILTLHDSDQVIHDVLDVGARGYLLKSDSGSELVAAVDALLRDKTYFTPKVAAMVLAGYLGGGPSFSPGRNPLTPREREVEYVLSRNNASTA